MGIVKADHHNLAKSVAPTFAASHALMDVDKPLDEVVKTISKRGKGGAGRGGAHKKQHAKKTATTAAASGARIVKPGRGARTLPFAKSISLSSRQYRSQSPTRWACKLVCSHRLRWGIVLCTHSSDDCGSGHRALSTGWPPNCFGSQHNSSP